MSDTFLDDKDLYLTVIPLPFHNDEFFWGRDMGLLALGMRAQGYNAKVVALGDRSKCDPSLPVILGSMEDFENRDWWKQHKPVGVILNAWNATRYDNIRKAILSVTPRVIEKLDTDGVRLPSTWMWKFLYSSYGSYRDSTSLTKKLFAPILALARTVSIYLIPNLLERKMAHSMAQIPVHAAESPIAVARIQRFLRRNLDTIPQVVCIPHPVANDGMEYKLSMSKENRIVCVGRWNSYQKNFPLLIKVLRRFLEIHPSWSADIIGTLPKKWKMKGNHDQMVDRIRFHGHISHQLIHIIYQNSKIYFMSSRYESFNIAAAEALCCGCSVVGSAEIASVLFFTGEQSGTASSRQSVPHFLDALNAEVEAWESGNRIPNLISEKWISLVGSTSVGKKVVTCFGTIAA